MAKFTALQSGQPWAGCESSHGNNDLGPFVLDSTNSIIKIMVWKPVISDVGIKLVAATGWAQPEIKIANTLVNQWEELTFDFSAYPNPPGSEGQYDQIVIFPDFDMAGRTQDNVIYFDNITFNSQGTNPGLPGDSNCDGVVNVLDVVITASYILGNNPQPFCFENADLNGDGNVNIIDIVSTVNIILGK